MKKYLSLFFIIGFICLFTASCYDNAKRKAENDVKSTQSNIKPGDNIDLDLTELSSTMVYVEVYNIMDNPNGYLGKTIKASGDYNVYYDKENNIFYHYFIIRDATGCCPQGLDFIWNGDHKFPDNYPAINSKIELKGIYSRKEVLGQTYYYLAVDEITVVG